MTAGRESQQSWLQANKYQPDMPVGTFPGALAPQTQLVKEPGVNGERKSVFFLCAATEANHLPPLCSVSSHTSSTLQSFSQHPQIYYSACWHQPRHPSTQISSVHPLDESDRISVWPLWLYLFYIQHAAILLHWEEKKQLHSFKEQNSNPVIKDFYTRSHLQRWSNLDLNGLQEVKKLK